jgi:hypothetical protein
MENNNKKTEEENEKSKGPEGVLGEPGSNEPKKDATSVVKPKVTSQRGSGAAASNVIKVKAKNEVVIKNTLGQEVPASDYFYKNVVPSGFEGTCGKPVDREDLLTLFHRVFKPEDGILFYKQNDKEVYLVIVPIKYSVSVGDFNDSMDGDFQKHAISFLDEGSVNLDTLRQKLERIVKFVKYSDR